MSPYRPWRIPSDPRSRQAAEAGVKAKNPMSVIEPLPPPLAGFAIPVLAKPAKAASGRQKVIATYARPMRILFL